MEKILLVDANFSSAPIYDYLLSTGAEVYVCGANPADYLAKAVPNYINFDYSDVGKLRSFVKSLGIKYVVPGCNDRSYHACAELNKDGEFLGIDDCNSTEAINNKEKFRRLAQEIGIPVPRVIGVESMEHEWPVIVKPTDAYSGLGIAVISRSDAKLLPQAIENAKLFSRSKTCIVEEYVEGQLFSHSAFIRDGEVFRDFIVEEFCNVNPFVVDTSRVVTDFSEKLLSVLREAIAKLSKKLNFGDGLVHTQFISRGSSVWLIELTRRCPGDLYSKLIEDSTGFPYAATYAKPFVGASMFEDFSLMTSKHVMRHTITLPVEKIYGQLEFSRAVEIRRFVPLSVVGDLVKKSPSGRIGVLFVLAESEAHLADLMQATSRRELYKVH
jgi:hypothetical protein